MASLSGCLWAVLAVGVSGLGLLSAGPVNPGGVMWFGFLARNASYSRSSRRLAFILQPVSC